MQTDVQMRKPRGRLSRHVQNKLGETLHAMFDEIVKEGVPERFSRLLEQIEGVRINSPPRTEPLTKSGDFEATGSRAETPLRARGSDRPPQKPEDKGSS